jgi:hypothetical protein
MSKRKRIEISFIEFQASFVLGAALRRRSFGIGAPTLVTQTVGLR